VHNRPFRRIGVPDRCIAGYAFAMAPTDSTPTDSTPTDSGLTFIGNATTLIRHGGFTILTDPNFLRRGQAAYLGRGLVSRRLHDPALSIEELPELDVCVLSHLHGDHWDRVARRGLPKTLSVVSTRHAARHLRRQGFPDTTALATWETHELRKGTSTLRITAMPGQHGLGRSRLIAPPPVMGSLLEFTAAGTDRPLRVYISGDTLVYDGLRQIRERHPDIDLAILHLGGTRILGMLLTMDAAQGLQLLDLVAPRRAVPIHFDDYPVFRSPISDFRDAVAGRGIADRVTFIQRGLTVPLQPA